jgi:hypothetical protein
MKPVDALRAALSGLPDVETTHSRFGSSRPAWRIAGREFAHLHSDALIDLRLPRAAQARLRADPRAHARQGRSDWIEFEFLSEKDVDEVVALVRSAAEAARLRT